MKPVDVFLLWVASGAILGALMAIIEQLHAIEHALNIVAGIQ